VQEHITLRCRGVLGVRTDGHAVFRGNIPYPREGCVPRRMTSFEWHIEGRPNLRRREA
jgi:hypothetical protein